MTTNVDIANRALAASGMRSKITSFTDGSQEALYVNLLYNSLRDFLLREGDYGFALTKVDAITVVGPPFPWTFTYEYPAGALRIRQLIPTVRVVLDPQAVEWNIFAAGGSNIIGTNISIASILHTFAPAEDNWDALFSTAFVRLLSSSLTFALSNRIEASKEQLNEAITFAGIANLRDS